jgi:hypothetical protein
LRAFGVEVPALTSVPRQVALAALGVVLVVYALKPGFLFNKPPPPPQGPIGAVVSSDPVAVPVGGSTEIAVRAAASDGAALADAEVDIQAGAGTFQNGYTRIIGHTGANGLFQAMWRAPAANLPGNTGYAFNVTVSKPGMTDWNKPFGVRVAP